MRYEWHVRYEGPGFCKHSGHHTEQDAYETAQAARALAEMGEGVGFVSWLGEDVFAPNVLAIHVLRLHKPSGEYLAHSRAWNKDADVDAFKPHPEDHWDWYTAR